MRSCIWRCLSAESSFNKGLKPAHRCVYPACGTAQAMGVQQLECKSQRPLLRRPLLRRPLLRGRSQLSAMAAQLQEAHQINKKSPGAIRGFPANAQAGRGIG
jgi:hypothetical protein